MAAAGICLIIVATAYLGVMTIGSVIWGITMLIDYLEVEKMFRKSKATLVYPPKPNLPPIPNKYICGVDLSSKKDSTVHTININVNAENIDKDKLIEEIIKNLNNPKNPRRSGTIA